MKVNRSCLKCSRPLECDLGPEWFMGKRFVMRTVIWPAHDDPATGAPCGMDTPLHYTVDIRDLPPVGQLALF